MRAQVFSGIVGVILAVIDGCALQDPPTVAALVFTLIKTCVLHSWQN